MQGGCDREDGDLDSEGDAMGFPPLCMLGHKMPMRQMSNLCDGITASYFCREIAMSCTYLSGGDV